MQGRTCEGGSCIKCYQCNSEYDPRCGDPFDSYSIGEVDCDRKPRLEHVNYNASLCRKTSQKVNGKLRTIRTCGYLPAENDQLTCVHRSGTYEVHINYCACKGDLCNGANIPREVSISLLLLPLLLLAKFNNVL
ncbi:hypothetical protein B566_EDAN001046 [Ephemera danica]|nr:hypothetical protein B566_EDAN001046 [Ephemera danica]